jgi:hypothetical protein
VKKLFGVGLVGTLALVIALWAMSKKTDAEAASANTTNAAGTNPASSTGGVNVNAVSSAVTAATPTVAVSDHAACVRLAELCTTSKQKVDVADCERQLADARKMSGASNVERSNVCVADATSCAAASGCVSGTVGMGAFGEFMKGFGSALSH